MRAHHALELQTRSTEVDQQTSLKPGRLEVVEELRFLFSGQLAQRLQFHYDRTVTDQVCPEERDKLMFLIVDRKFRFTDERDASLLQFETKCFMVNGSMKPWPSTDCTSIAAPMIACVSGSRSACKSIPCCSICIHLRHLRTISLQEGHVPDPFLPQRGETIARLDAPYVHILLQRFATIEVAAVPCFTERG